MSTSKNVSIYGYDNFRTFLKDRFEAMKAITPGYTHRAFAKDAKLSNPGYLNDVIKGRRPLSKNASEKIIAVFSMPPAEAEFFRILVDYCQCKKSEKKQDLYHRITTRRNRSSFSQLNPALTKYYQDFRYPLLRTAIQAFDFRGNYEELGRFVRPHIPSATVKKCIRDLCDWELVKQGPDGKYETTEKFVEPAPTLNEQVRQINREWISQAADALMTLPPEKRHVSSMILGLSPAAAIKISGKINKLREEIWELVKNDTDQASCLMQMNIQYFPKSGVREKL